MCQLCSSKKDISCAALTNAHACSKYHETESLKTVFEACVHCLLAAYAMFEGLLMKCGCLQELRVAWKNERRENPKPGMYVGDLSSEVDDFAIRQAFETSSGYCGAEVMWDHRTGFHKKFGFVFFRYRRSITQDVITDPSSFACYSSLASVFYL